MVMIGLDPEVVESAASSLANESANLNALIGRVESLVSVAGRSWRGSDAQSFVQAWQGCQRSQMKSAADVLSAMSSELKQNATQQRAASAATGFGAGSVSAAVMAVVTAVGQSAMSVFEHWSVTMETMFDPEEPHEPVEPDLLTPGALDPSKVAQGENIGDCWLMSTIMSIMNTDEGDALIRKNVQWDPDRAGYTVTLYDKGKPVEVFVDLIYANGAGATQYDQGSQSIASVYEAAIAQHFGYDILTGDWPSSAMEMIVNECPLEERLVGGDAAYGLVHDYADGISKGTIIVAGSTLAASGEHVHVSYSENGSLNDGEVRLVGNHAYTVVGVGSDGRVGIMNPWGTGQQTVLGQAYDPGGVMWISKGDFVKYFTTATVGSI